jgi:hypothetical protein
MTKFAAIPAARGKVEFIYSEQPLPNIATRISGPDFRATYFVAVGLSGRQLLATVPPGGMGQVMVYPKPSVLVYIQSDAQSMWGRNCPRCEKYFRTNHVVGDTCCPYCAAGGADLEFVTKAQYQYIEAFYDAWARAHMGKMNTSLDVEAITDQTPAWHYAEERQEVHFKCATPDCHTETDVLGNGNAYCPRCGRTNARKLFTEFINETLTRIETTKNTISDDQARGPTWEEITKNVVTKFETLAEHLSCRLKSLPMTAKRRKELERVNFQDPVGADESLRQWFDVGLLEWAGNASTPKRTIKTDSTFIAKMFQKRHVLTHTEIVDQKYLDRSGDTEFRLGQRIAVHTSEIRRFIEAVKAMGENFLDNVEYAFQA